MTPMEAAFLNHLRVVYPIGFKDHASSGPRKDETVLEEYRPDQLADWAAGARWGAANQDVEPEALISVPPPHKAPALPWTKDIPRGGGRLVD